MRKRLAAKRISIKASRKSRSVRTPIIDLHAHFAMQLEPPDRPCDDTVQTERNRALMKAANRFANFENPFSVEPDPRYKLAAAKRAGVHFASVLYQPADELFGPCEPFANLRKQITLVNGALARGRFKLAKTPGDLKRFIENGEAVAFHSLEGAFSVGEPGNVRALAGEGLAYIILAHLVFRNISASVNAFPFMSDAEYDRMFAMPVKGLTSLGVDICTEICRSGIIPDITHATKEAADEVFRIAAANRPRRPVIVSHGAPQGGTASEYKLNLTEDAITKIRDSGGVVGVIFYDHWLLPVGAPPRTPTGISLVVDAIKRIRDSAGTTDCIAIGSDLDGFIQPVKGLENVSKFRDLERELRAHFDATVVEAILWKNALRTLSMGWGR
jgi:microsomal dipeptidase-like Zn-dependent dipeptidase